MGQNILGNIGNGVQNLFAKAQEQQRVNEQWKNENRNDIIYNNFKNSLDMKRLNGDITASEYDKRLEDLPNLIDAWCPAFDKDAWQTAQEKAQQEQQEQRELRQLLERRQETGNSMATVDNAYSQLSGTGTYMIVGNINNSQAKILGDPQAVAALGGNVAFSGLPADQIAASNLAEKDKVELYAKQQGILGVINMNSLRQNFTATAANGVQNGMTGLQTAVSGGSDYADFVNAQNIANGGVNNHYIIATGANEAAYYQNGNSGCNASYMALPQNFQLCHGPNVNYMPCQMSVDDMMYASSSPNFQQGYNLYQQQQLFQNQNQNQPNLPAWALQNNQPQSIGHNHSYNQPQNIGHNHSHSHSHSNCRGGSYSGDNNDAGGFDNC